MGKTVHKRFCAKGVVKKTSKEFRRTPYNLPGAVRPTTPRLRSLVDDFSYPAVMRMSDAQSGQLLRKLGFKPSTVAKQRQCWKCHGPVRKYQKVGGCFFRCAAKACRKKYCEKAYTPLHNRGGGSSEDGDDTLRPSEYLRCSWAYGYRLPPDVTIPLTEVSRRKVERVFDYLRVASSDTTEQLCKEAFFDGPITEADTARAMGKHPDKKTTEHRGRTLVVVDRQSGKTAYARLPTKQTIKGAPTPPEEYNEVQPVLDHLLGQTMLAGDGSWAWKQHAKKNGLGPVLDATHQKKEYVKLHKVPAPSGSVAKKVLEKLGHPMKRKLRVKGGGNRAEAAIGAVKGVLRRRNGLKNGRHAGSNMLAAAFSKHHPGLRPLGLAVKGFLSRVVDKKDPLTYWKPGAQHKFDIFDSAA